MTKKQFCLTLALAVLAGFLGGLLAGFLFSAGVVPLNFLEPHAQQNAKGSLAYIQGGNLWVKELPEGEAKQLTTTGNITSPRWSPSGQWLAYLKGSQLWVLQRPGEVLSQIIEL